MVNSVTLIGPCYNMKEFQLNSGKKMIKFTLKTWMKLGETEKKTFHSITAYGGAAEVIAKYWEEGKKMCVQGRLDSYKDKNDVYKTDIVLEEFTFISSDS
jgi:single-stranded DNA-binding protein